MSKFESLSNEELFVEVNNARKELLACAESLTEAVVTEELKILGDKFTELHAEVEERGLTVEYFATRVAKMSDKKLLNRAKVQSGVVDKDEAPGGNAYTPRANLALKFWFVFEDELKKRGLLGEFRKVDS